MTEILEQLIQLDALQIKSLDDREKWASIEADIQDAEKQFEVLAGRQCPPSFLRILRVDLCD
tara:strand:- start:215 stop:400 length:186 start_codon:yes stop_codon:yes gene_type:complete